MRDRFVIEGPNLILVEGSDDRFVLESLIEHRALARVQIKATGGRERLFQQTRLLHLVPGFERLRKVAVICDADDDPTGAWKALSGALAHGARLPVPDRPGVFVGGTGTADDPSVGTWLLPAADRPGALEDLLWPAARFEVRKTCAEQAVRCALDDGLPPRAMSKALVYTWSGLLDRPPDTMKTALRITRGGEPVFDLDHSAFDDLVAFLRKL